MDRQQIIIFDGPDMCGKTEIAKAYSRLTKVPYFKASSEHATYLTGQDAFLSQLQHADPRVLDLLRQTGHSVIFDRAYPSEWVYSFLLGRKTDLNTLRYLDEEYAKLGAMMVLCHRSSYKGIVDDIDAKLDAKMLRELDNLYLSFTRWTKLRTLVLNVDDENLQRELNDIIMFTGAF